MPPRFSIWMVLAGVAAGVIVGFLAGNGTIGRSSFAKKKEATREIRVSPQVLRPQSESGSALLAREALAGGSGEAMSTDDWFELLRELTGRKFGAPHQSLKQNKAEYQLSLLIARMPAEQVREVLEKLRLSSDRDDRRVRNLTQGRLMRRLVELDPQAAVTWAESIDDGKPWMALVIHALRDQAAFASENEAE